MGNLRGRRRRRGAVMTSTTLRRKSTRWMYHFNKLVLNLVDFNQVPMVKNLQDLPENKKCSSNYIVLNKISPNFHSIMQFYPLPMITCSTSPSFRVPSFPSPISPPTFATPPHGLGPLEGAGKHRLDRLMEKSSSWYRWGWCGNGVDVMLWSCMKDIQRYALPSCTGARIIYFFAINSLTLSGNQLIMSSSNS